MDVMTSSMRLPHGVSQLVTVMVIPKAQATTTMNQRSAVVLPLEIRSSVAVNATFPNAIAGCKKVKDMEASLQP